jgi:hypothetical protein
MAYKLGLNPSGRLNELRESAIHSAVGINSRMGSQDLGLLIRIQGHFPVAFARIVGEPGLEWGPLKGGTIRDRVSSLIKRRIKGKRRIMGENHKSINGKAQCHVGIAFGLDLAKQLKIYAFCVGRVRHCVGTVLVGRTIRRLHQTT